MANIFISKDKVERLRTKLGNICAANDQCVDSGIYDNEEANALEEINVLLINLLESESVGALSSIDDDGPMFSEKYGTNDDNEEE